MAIAGKRELERRCSRESSEGDLPGNDSATVEGAPQVVRDLLRGCVGADGVLHGEDPAEDFLIGKT